MRATVNRKGWPWLTASAAHLATGKEGQRGLIQAGAVISILPIVVMFFIGQEHFIQGIARTGLKG